MKIGIYILANDAVYDQFVALLNSLEVNGAKDLPVCVIPYDNQLDKIKQEIALRNQVTLFDNPASIKFWEDFATQAWISHKTAQKLLRTQAGKSVPRLSMHRKFCAFDGDFEKFIYFDADTLLMSSLDYIDQQLEHYDWVANDFQYKSDLNYVFDLSSPKVSEIFPLDQLPSQIFCAGWFAAKKACLTSSGLTHLLEKLKAGEAEVLALQGADQALLNYVVGRSGISFYNFAYHQPEQVTGNHWSSQFEAINYILYDRGRPLTYLHYMSIPASQFRQLCQGEAVDIPYRDVFLHYRYLKSPEQQPKLRPPSLWVRWQRNLKTWLLQKVSNLQYRFRHLN